MEEWRKITERDDCMISNQGRVKKLSETIITSPSIHYTTKTGQKTTISVSKLMEKYFPDMTELDNEIWCPIDERPNCFISNFKRVKSITETILKSVCVGYQDGKKRRQINVTTLVAKYFPLPDLEGEVWKDIPEYSNYQISSCKRVKNIKTNYLMKHSVKEGYTVVNIVKDDGKEHALKLHILMAKIFFKPVPGKNLVNHIDGNTQNPELINLEYTDASGNLKHAIEMGLFKPCREVNQIDIKSGKVIATHKSMKAAAASIGITRIKSIGEACKFQRPYHGFMWDFAVKKEKEIHLPIKGEKWKQFKDTIYMVSTFGRVKNSKTGRFRAVNYTKGQNGKGKRAKVTLSLDGSPKQFIISRLVAMTYIPNPHNLPEVDHIDKNPLNDKVENLRWSTNADNIRHSFARPINQLTLDGKLVKRWDAMMDAKRAGFHPWHCLNGTIETYKGYKWEYAE